MSLMKTKHIANNVTYYTICCYIGYGKSGNNKSYTYRRKYKNKRSQSNLCISLGTLVPNSRDRHDKNGY